MSLADSEILVGTYEAFLLGFKVIKSSENDLSIKSNYDTLDF